jgi:hypothetical protein
MWHLRRGNKKNKTHIPWVIFGASPLSQKIQGLYSPSSLWIFPIFQTFHYIIFWSGFCKGIYNNYWNMCKLARYCELKWDNIIFLLALWLGTENNIRGKVVASPKSKPWWVLLVRVCPWFVGAPKVLQLCINQLVV